MKVRDLKEILNEYPDFYDVEIEVDMIGYAHHDRYGDFTDYCTDERFLNEPVLEVKKYNTFVLICN